ncbi:hypothetical protein [Massilia alkalitolerans]|uniref:hypothetical protein n=1 Tax=Massilia alkalitolerans TaxID=286638 RepID=UPI00353112E0
MKNKPAAPMAEAADIQRPFSPVRAGVYFTAILLFCLNHWINRYFGRPDIDQIAYHLQFGTQGLEASDPAIAERFLRWCVLIPLFLLATVLLAERWAIVACRYGLILRACPVLPQAALLAAVLLWLVQLSVVDYLRSGMGPDYFSMQFPLLRADARHRLDHRRHGGHAVRHTAQAGHDLRREHARATGPLLPAERHLPRRHPGPARLPQRVHGRGLDQLRRQGTLPARPSVPRGARQGGLASPGGA